jgi:hypothetical protein
MARQINVSFPDDVRKRLAGAAEAAGHSIAEEIRTRVARTFAEEQMDPRMRELLALIVKLDESLQSDFGFAWHAETGVHHAFAAGVAQLLADLAPVHTEAAVSATLGIGVYGEDGAAAGRTHARLIQRGHSYPHLEAAKQARGKPRIGELARHAKKKGE